MHQIKCPNCGEFFSVSETHYESILKQIRNEEFNKELKHYETEYQKEKENALTLLKTELKSEYDQKLNNKNLEIQELQTNIKLKEEQTRANERTIHKKSIRKRIY